jgi:hypothetical protein
MITTNLVLMVSGQHLLEQMAADSPDHNRFLLVISSMNQPLVCFSVFAIGNETNIIDWKLCSVFDLNKRQFPPL